MTHSKLCLLTSRREAEEKQNSRQIHGGTLEIETGVCKGRERKRAKVVKQPQVKIADYIVYSIYCYTTHFCTFGTVRSSSTPHPTAAVVSALASLAAKWCVSSSARGFPAHRGSSGSGVATIFFPSIRHP